MKNNGEQILEGKPTIATLLEITDQAVEKKKTAMSAAEILDLDNTIASQIPTVMSLAQKRGITITEDEARQALIDQVEKLYNYISGKKDKVADAWVDRKRISKVYGRPILGGVLGLAIIFAGVKFVPPLITAGKVAGVEKTVEQLYQQREQMQKDIHAQNPADAFSGLNGLLNRTNGFFDQYCDGGEAHDDVTINNYKQAKSEVPAVQTVLKSASDLLAAKQKFDQAYATVKPGAESVGIADVAAKIFDTAMGQLKTLDLAGLNASIVSMKALGGMLTAKTELDGVYSSMQAKAKEEGAVDVAQGIYADAAAQVQAGDTAGLASTVAALKNLDTVLTSIQTLESQVDAGTVTKARLLTSIDGKHNPQLFGNLSNAVAGTAGFFAIYAPGGKSEEAINYQDYNDAQTQWVAVSSVLESGQRILISSDSLEQLITSIKQVVKEDKARQQATTLYDSGLGYIKAMDAAALAGAVEALGKIDTELKLVYTVRIVQRVGVDTGFIWGSYQNDPNSLYYFNVEAVDPKEKIIPMEIKDEKRGWTKTEDYWLERVPQSLYKALEADFTAHNNTLTNDTLAKKPLGYLTWTFEMPGMTQRLGQLTDWSAGQ